MVLDGYFHELDLEDECLRASLKNAMYDFDQNKQTPLMLAVRSGRYQDVEAILNLCQMDFKIAGCASAWDLALLIADPCMMQILSDGRLRQQKRDWRKKE